MQWKHKGSPTPRKFRVQKSAGKIMATLFWDSEGLLLLEFMPDECTITGDSYATTMKNLHDTIEEKRRGKLSRGVLLLHDNAPVHKSWKVEAALRECGFQELNHPPYSPDLAPSDYFLFRHLTRFLRGKIFSCNEELKVAVSDWFDGQEVDFYSQGIKSLESKWNKCVELKGDYIEK